MGIRLGRGAPSRRCLDRNPLWPEGKNAAARVGPQSAMPKPKPTPKVPELFEYERRLFRWMKGSPGAFRDGALLVAGLLYVLGYVVWSIYAWRNHLGILPALQAQYFLAGLVPLAILWATMSAAHVLNFGRGWLQRAQGTKRWVRYARSGVYLLFLVSFYGWQAREVFPGQFLSAIPGWAFWTGGLVGFVLMPDVPGVRVVGKPPEGEPVPPAEAPPAPRSRPRPLHALLESQRVLFSSVQKGVAMLAPIGVALWIIVTFVTVTYAQVPQEFGGVEPRCAQLDLALSEVSADFYDALHARNSTASGMGVFRTAEVRVLFDGPSFLLLRLPGEGHTDNYQVNKDAIRAIVWC